MATPDGDLPLIDLTDTQMLGVEGLSRYECRSCGYVYEPTKGDQLRQIAPGTAFEALPATWRCPVCGAPQAMFEEKGATGKPSGFQENLRYGLGVNTLTPGQKNLLIFLGLGLGFAFLMSFYFVQ
ncbi:MAG: rubredoxin [Thermostichales cyanobacterium BF4_bins_65]